LIDIAIKIEYPGSGIDTDRLNRAVEVVLMEEGVEAAAIIVAVVDDARIRDLNRRYLDHDEPTDVLSFDLADENGRLEGDVVVSAEMAERAATRLLWPAGDELLLYVIHGILHLVGYDDLDVPSRTDMRRRERHYLARFGLHPPAIDLAGESPDGSQEGNPELLLSHEFSP
jgi:probable rRNA maturation factor